MKDFPKRALFLIAAAALFVVAMMGDVSAQGTAAGVGAREAARDDGGGAQAAPDKLTRKQKISWVEERVGEAYQVRSRVQSMLDQARKEKDTIKISCLADKLTQLEVNLQGIEERRSAFDEALSGGDEANIEQQFTVLQIYLSRIQSLMAESENCVGEGDVVVGESETTVTIDEDITVDDPSNPSDVEQIAIDQPVQASAYY
jgi:hypothetical protein